MPDLGDFGLTKNSYDRSSELVFQRTTWIRERKKMAQMVAHLSCCIPCLDRALRVTDIIALTVGYFVS